MEGPLQGPEIEQLENSTVSFFILSTWHLLLICQCGHDCFNGGGKGKGGGGGGEEEEGA